MLNPFSKEIIERFKEHVLQMYCEKFGVSKNEAIQAIRKEIEDNIEFYSPYNYGYNLALKGEYLFYYEDIKNFLQTLLEADIDDDEETVFSAQTSNYLYKHMVGTVYQYIFERR